MSPGKGEGLEGRGVAAKGLTRPDYWNKFLLSTLAAAGQRGLLLPWARTGSDEHPDGESSKGQLGTFFLGLPSGITGLVLGGPGSLLGAVEGTGYWARLPWGKYCLQQPSSGPQHPCHRNRLSTL